MMELRPIFSALMRNKLGAVLVAAQIAVTMAVLCNGAFIVYQRMEKMNRPTGMDVENIFSIASMSIGRNHDELGTIRQDLETIRSTPGVEAATTINSVPLSGSGWGEGLATDTDPETPNLSANLYFVDEQALDALGVNLVAGRGFNSDELLLRDPRRAEYPEVAIITQALADGLFPDESALGKTIYSDQFPMRVVGIVDRMQGSWLGWDGVERVLLIPGRMIQGYIYYLIRTEPGQRDALMPQIEEALAAANSNRILRNLRSLEEYRARSYGEDRTVAITLVAVMILLVVVTSLGIVGLAAFLVNQRTKQIGTRRALGARRFHVIRYFLVENWMVTSMGLSVGLILTVALNYWMVQTFEMPRLDWIYIPIGLVLIWILGIGSALGPARRAARVSPAVATRTV